MRKKEKRLQFDQLESRLLLAGDVKVAVVNGDLQITGDAAANGVLVAQVDTTTFIVRGLRAGGQPTTINGKPRRGFRNVTGEVKINMGPGADRIYVGRAAKGSILPKGLTINAGKGADQVVCRNLVAKGDIVVDLGAGNDRLNINKTKARGNVELVGGDSNDRLVLNSSIFKKRLRVLTGAGEDKLFLNKTRAKRLVSLLGDQADLISVSRVFVRSAYVHGGQGRDTLRVFRSDSETEPTVLSIERFVEPD